ncbi:hypothetical protein CEXT_731661 [Caerostris extrusa]|uniref:Uncharacterized protein n=1 Tax=Caerostris extrusa TaxID=172846 RepID=A0AAV4R3M4_CAEEX|nr:hypothetical protein CEXT_731661 [Caerostris extrusa]
MLHFLRPRRWGKGGPGPNCSEGKNFPEKSTMEEDSGFREIGWKENGRGEEEKGEAKEGVRSDRSQKERKINAEQLPNRDLIPGCDRPANYHISCPIHHRIPRLRLRFLLSITASSSLSPPPPPQQH